MSSVAAHPIEKTYLFPALNIPPSFRSQRPYRNSSARRHESRGKPLQLWRNSATASEGVRTPGENAFPVVSELDSAARDCLLMEHLPQVRCIARRIHDRLPPHVQLEDLVHAGVLGLIEALRKYDPTKHVEFKSYARFRIQGAILDSLRDLDWAPRALRKRGRDLERAHEKLRVRLGRPPTDPEVAAELGVDLRKLQRLVNSLWKANVCSFQQVTSAEGTRQEESHADLALAQTEDPYTTCLRGEISHLLARALADLPPRGRRVLALYYFEERTMKEVARALGVCEARVSQIHSAALVPLRARLADLLASKRAPRQAGLCPPVETDPRVAFAGTSFAPFPHLP